MIVSKSAAPLIGKEVVATYATDGFSFTGRVIGYMAEPMYWIELPDGTKRWWAESLTKEAWEKSTVAMGWQPIETAPKDGSIILLAGGVWGDDDMEVAARVMCARWYKSNLYDDAFWNACEAECGHSIFPYKGPTHWMPLPSPPEGV